MARIEISLVIPCFNEGSIFEENVAEIIKVLESTNEKWEMILVDDKSQDNTKKSIQKIISNNNSIRAIYHPKNQGRGKAVEDGIKKAKGRICGYLDVDLEVSSSYIPLFVEEIKKGGAEMVVAKRFYEGGIFGSMIRYLASKIYAFSVRLILNTPIEDTEAGYKFFERKKILPILAKVKNKHWFWDTEICATAHLSGLRISQIPTLFNRRSDKKSTVKIIPDTYDYIKSLLRFKYELVFKNR